MDRLTEMEAFVSVVDQGGFTDAARKLGVSKSAISKHVSALEARLGARLLNRTTRRVSPTEIGLAYYDRANRVLSEAGEADAMVAAMQSGPRGELRVSAPMSFGVTHLAPAVAGFLCTYPDVSVHLVLDDRRVELVAEGFDLAIRIGELPDSSLRARRFADAHARLVASPDYLARRGVPETIEDLTAHELLHYSNLATGNYWKIRTPSGEERHIRARGRLTVNNGEALKLAAAEGLGIALVPTFILRDELQMDHLTEVLPGVIQEELGIYAVYPPGRYPQPKLRAFIDYLADTFKGQTVW
ncbi:MAG: LysR family transcriptional regulator [Pseudomonadota bacterium]